MKLSSKSMVSSSPNRIEKFPAAPQLLSRFSRSSGGSRSRGRTRAGPIFFSAFARKKTTAESETPEPSSPKVTCIGQVRVRRSKPRPKSTATAAPARSFCRWLQTALFGQCFAHRKRSSSPPPPQSKLLRRLLFVSVRKPPRKKVVQEQDEPAAVRDLEPLGQFKSDSDSEEEEEEKDGEAKIFVASTPPKNALLLMRCRSEPRRAPALADRFWGSPPSSAGAEDGALSSVNRPLSPAGGNDGSSTAAPMQRKEEQEDGDGENAGRHLEVSPRPLILTRCKSEPSTRTANLVPDEACLWKNRRLGFARRCQSPHAYLD